MKLKHILLVVGIVLLACVVVGCVIEDKNDNELLYTYHYSDALGYHYISIYVDEYTGVEYLVYSGDGAYSGYGGICPRYNPDGTLKINEEFME